MRIPTLLDSIMLHGIDESWITPIKEDSSMEFDTYIEIPVKVHYDYSPEEKQVLYPNDKADPGCPASVTINSVETDEQTDIWADLDGGTQQSLIDDVMESLRGDE
jgi:hypothetical protein